MTQRRRLYTITYTLALSLAFLLAVGALIGASIFTNKQNVAAQGFSAGNIMSDAVFINASSMSPSQIQAFLNSKVPTCDTWGTQPSEYGGGTRRQWAEARGYAPPYTCLKDYSQNGKSSAQIIYDTAQEFQINPQVFIVLLQKEQGLVTDTWPLSTQYRSATGYGCPDSAPCDSQYYGLTNQIRWAARMFRAIMNASPTWYTPYILGNNYIRYSPNSACGGSTVNIQNRATQALYNYTPYQPNQETLNASMGTVVHCGAYGNINFYRYFTSWFGSTQQPLPGCSASASRTTCVWKLIDRNGKQFLTTSISERNNLVGSGAYTFAGVAFYGRTHPVSGSIPVYRLYFGDRHFWTANAGERDALAAQGATVEGVAWYADPAGTNAGYPTYRLYNNAKGSHIWTTSPAEKSQLVAGGYSLESVVFSSASPIVEVWAPGSGKAHIYRLYHPHGKHHWTSNVNERDTLLRAGYRYEGVGWSASATATTTPVYRLYERSTGHHFWTKNVNEKNILQGSGFTYEGIGWYEPSVQAAPAYRLYERHTGRHFWTRNVNEKNALQSSGYTYEGVGWYE